MLSVFDSKFDDNCSPLNERFFGVEMTVTRGATTITVTVLAGGKPYSPLDSDGNKTDVTVYDLDVRAATYQTIGSDPVSGDRFTDSAGNIYEVMPLDGDRCFIPADSTLPAIYHRIHTKRVKVV